MRKAFWEEGPSPGQGGSKMLPLLLSLLGTVTSRAVQAAEELTAEKEGRRARRPGAVPGRNKEARRQRE